MNNFKSKFAEELPYWKTGQSADKAISEAKSAITKNGGKITGEGFGMTDNQGAFFLQFEMHGEEFRYVEQIMQSKTGNERAAKIQAAASLKHAIKARVNEAMRHGARRAFMSSLLLPNGQIIHQQSNESLIRLFAPISPANLLDSGTDIIEGEMIE